MSNIFNYFMMFKLAQLPDTLLSIMPEKRQIFDATFAVMTVYDSSVIHSPVWISPVKKYR